MVWLKVTPVMDRFLKNQLKLATGDTERIEQLNSFLGREVIPHNFLANYLEMTSSCSTQNGTSLSIATSKRVGIEKLTEESRLDSFFKLTRYSVVTFPELDLELDPEEIHSGNDVTDSLPENLESRLRSIVTVRQNAEYEAASKTFLRGSHCEDHLNFSSDIREAKSIISSVINVVFSMVAVFTAIWYCIPYSFMTDPGLKTLIALFGCLIVGVAEAYFFAKDWLH